VAELSVPAGAAPRALRGVLLFRATILPFSASTLTSVMAFGDVAMPNE
jgi:hypothetical protein